VKKATKVHDWDVWQSYRKDRGTPPWIKVHRCLLSCAKWASLTDAEKGQLVSLWLIAADNAGMIPHDTRVLRKVCMLDEEPNIRKFIELGLLEELCQPHDANMTPTCQQYDTPETETETETEKKRIRKEKKPYGDFKNVFFSDVELKTLSEKFGNDLEEKINNLSIGIESKGYKYKSHYATILSWSRKDDKQNHKTDKSYDPTYGTGRIPL